jgi:hypothetical protein
VALATGCGSLSVTTERGSAWRLDPGDAGNATANVTTSPTGLSVDAGTTGRWHLGSSSERTWRVVLPTSPIDALRLDVSAGDADVDLEGAQLGALGIRLNGGDIVVDASEAALTELSASARLGALAVRLPDADLTGSLEVTLGEIEVCLPSDVGLRVSRGAELGVVRYEGFEQRAHVWQSPGYEQAPHHVDLTVDVNLGSLEFDPIGGCQ